MSKFSFTSTTPTDHKLTDVDWNKKSITKIYFNPNITLRVGSYVNPVVSPWYLNTPFGADGKPTTADVFQQQIQDAIASPDPGAAGSALAYSLDLRFDHDVDEYKQYFNELNTHIANTCKEKKWFERDMSTDNVLFVMQDSMKVQRQHDYNYMRVKVSPTGLPNAPTLRLAVNKDENGYIWRDITTTDMLSPQDGGNGLLRNAKIIAIVEEVGVWLRKDPSIGIKWRLAQAFIIPSEEKPTTNSSRANNRSVDAFADIIPGGVRFE